MIFDQLGLASRYDGVHSGLAAGFRFLQSTDLGALQDGRHELDGDRLFVIVANSAGKGRSDARLEVHDRYMDIQVAISGTDEIGIKPRGECRQIDAGMDAERDIMFFRDQPDFWMQLTPGTFAVFFLDDAHAPLAGAGQVHKAVVKVAVHGW